MRRIGEKTMANYVMYGYNVKDDFGTADLSASAAQCAGGSLILCRLPQW